MEEMHLFGSYVMDKILFLRDHWYHLFVSIYYHISRETQAGILYKLSTIILIITPILFILTISVLTYQISRDIVNTLG